LFQHHWPRMHEPAAVSLTARNPPEPLAISSTTHVTSKLGSQPGATLEGRHILEGRLPASPAHLGEASLVLLATVWCLLGDAG
jgi:hypothetical protein